MLIAEFFIALIIAILLAVFFAAVLGWKRPGRSGIGPALVFLFLLLFLTTWAVGSWIQPFGPMLWGAYWLPYLFVGLIFALFIVSLIPPPRSSRRPPLSREESETETALGGFLWILVVIFVVAIIVHYA
jgi:hypothetical protein